uniref:Putative secreted protein n=1 Tax=Ixodes ricinus TaxID=34613 RepID=A0A147BEN8_IXORI
MWCCRDLAVFPLSMTGLAWSGPCCAGVATWFAVSAATMPSSESLFSPRLVTGGMSIAWPDAANGVISCQSASCHRQKRRRKSQNKCTFKLRSY